MPPDLSDEDLLRRFAQGERSALDSLARRHEPALLGLARGLLSGRADLAQEAVQDSWVRVIRFARDFDQRSAVKTWLYRIVINRCKDIRVKELATRDGHPGDPPVGTGGLSPTPLEETSRLRTHIDRLPDASRLILLLCYHRGLTHPQAAGVLGIPIGTLKSRLSAALAELRSSLPEETHP